MKTVTTIGVYYSTPFGVVDTISWNGIDKTIGWIKIKKTEGFRNVYEFGSSKEEDTKDWVMLNVDDFPESVDKNLPYVFDLLFDIKRMSQLRQAFKNENKEELLSLMKDHGIRFEKRKKKK